MSRPLKIRALVTLLLVGLMLAFSFGTASAEAASPSCDNPVSSHQIVSQDQILALASEDPHIDRHSLVANMLDCCSSSLCGIGCGAGAMASAEALTFSTPQIERSVWCSAPFAIPEGVNPRTDIRPPRLA